MIMSIKHGSVWKKVITLAGVSPLLIFTAVGHAAPANSSGLNACEMSATEAGAGYPCSAIVIPQHKQDTLAVAAMTRELGARAGLEIASLGAVAVEIPDQASMRALQARADIVLIPNRTVSITGAATARGATKDSGQVVSSGVSRIGAGPGVLPYSGQGVGVALLDTGLDFDHADLAPAAVCFDAYDGDCVDGNGHGTHVGGIVAALDNSRDVVGVAPAATVYAVKVLNDSGSGSDATIMAGLDWVISNATSVSPAIKVVNMSLGREGQVDDNPAMHVLIQTLVQMGITVVVSAGNDAALEVSQRIPAAYAEVITVASTAALDGSNRCRSFAGFIGADTASYFTTDGAAVSISAPGEQQENIDRFCAGSSSGILSLQAGGGTVRMSGTSMAAPMVTGVVALLHQQQQIVEPEAIRSALMTSAQGVGLLPGDSPFANYSFDGVREGVLSACGALNVSCP